MIYFTFIFLIKNIQFVVLIILFLAYYKGKKRHNLF